MTQSPTLVLLASREAYVEEAARQHNALAYMYDSLQAKDVRVYSWRTADASILSLSVLPDNRVEHIVGPRNRPPTREELQAVTTDLAALGFTVDYKADTIA